MTNHFDTTSLETLRQQIAAAKMLTQTCMPSWELVDALVERLRKDSQPSAMVSREAIEDCILDAIQEATGEDPSTDDDADAWLFSTKIHALQLPQPVAPVQGGGVDLSIDHIAEFLVLESANEVPLNQLPSAIQKKYRNKAQRLVAHLTATQAEAVIILGELVHIFDEMGLVGIDDPEDDEVCRGQVELAKARLFLRTAPGWKPG